MLITKGLKEQGARKHSFQITLLKLAKGICSKTLKSKLEKVASIIVANHMKHDLLKEPMNNQPNSAQLSKQVFNAFFSSYAEMVDKFILSCWSLQKCEVTVVMWYTSVLAVRPIIHW